MLASTIQFTTNPPTPTPHHPHKAAEHGSGNQGALPQNPDSMPPPHTPTHAGAPTTTQQGSSERVSHASTRQTNHPREQTHETQSTARPFRKGRPPAGPDPFNDPDNTRPGSHPA